MMDKKFDMADQVFAAVCGFLIGGLIGMIAMDTLFYDKPADMTMVPSQCAITVNNQTIVFSERLCDYGQ